MATQHQQSPLSDVGFLRLPEVLKVFPVSKSHFWAKVKKGEAPKPVKLGPKTTAWRAKDIREFLESIDTKEAA